MPKGAVNGHGGYPTLKRPATLDHLRAKPRPYRIVEIHGDLDAVRDLAAAEKRLLEAQMAIPSGVDEAERERRLAEATAEVDRLKELVESSTRQVLMGGVGRVRKRALLDEHPPRESDHAKAKEQGAQAAEFNLDSYPVALIAASLIDPQVTEEELEEITAEWTDGEFMMLWFAALEVNAESSLVGSGKATSGTRG